VVEQAGELAPADHAGLVHQQDRVGVEPVAALLEVGQQPIDRARVAEPLACKAAGGKPGRCRPDQPVTLQAVGMSSRPGHEGLAVAGLANKQRHPGARTGQVGERVGLVLPSPMPCSASSARHRS
jgi:hypothetical protein